MDVEFHIHGGVCVKKHSFKRGERGPKHVHDFDHLSAVANGFFRVEREGYPTVELGPGDTLQVIAQTLHTVTALTDGTWLCIHRDDVADEAHLNPPQPTNTP